MKEPTLIQYGLFAACCLAMTCFGLYLLANLNHLLRSRIKNDILRKNVVAWLIIFCISAGLFPMNNGFYYVVNKYGWWKMITGHLISTTLYAILIFNVVWLVAKHSRLQKLSFIKHTMLVFATLIMMIVAVSIPFEYFFFNFDIQHLKYAIILYIYMGAATGCVYAAINYLDGKQKRKFQEKELELSKLSQLKAKAELDALHAKVNPHFLYNALNSIADLSITDGSKGRKMTVALADLFRYSINYSNNNYSTVKEEVEMVEVYLQIEKIRFEDKLSYTIGVDEELNHYLVPRFVLQPLVENAVKHGLKSTGQMTEITMEVKKKNESIVMTVADNGPAFPDELNAGYGVKSVYDKLDLLFPGSYEIHFINEPQKQVCIYIKKLMKNEPAI